MAANMEKVIEVVYRYKVTPYRETSETKRNYLKITFTEFLALMRRTNICIDPRTARTKWETLIARDILADGQASKTAFIDLEMLESLGYECDLLPENQHTHNTHTIMERFDDVADTVNPYTHTTHTQKSEGVQ